MLRIFRGFRSSVSQSGVRSKLVNIEITFGVGDRDIRPLPGFCHQGRDRGGLIAIHLAQLVGQCWASQIGRGVRVGRVGV